MKGGARENTTRDTPIQNMNTNMSVYIYIHVRFKDNARTSTVRLIRTGMKRAKDRVRLAAVGRLGSLSNFAIAIMRNLAVCALPVIIWTIGRGWNQVVIVRGVEHAHFLLRTSWAATCTTLSIRTHHIVGRSVGCNHWHDASRRDRVVRRCRGLEFLDCSIDDGNAFRTDDKVVGALTGPEVCQIERK